MAIDDMMTLSEDGEAPMMDMVPESEPVEEQVAASQPPPSYDDQVNLVPTLPDWFLSAVGDQVIKTYDMDKMSGKTHKERVARWTKLFFGDVESSPQKNITVVHLPLLAKAMLTFQAKLHRNFFPLDGDILGVKPKSPSAVERAEAVSKDLNACVREKIPEYIPVHDRNSMRFLLAGSTFTAWRHDPVEDRLVLEGVSLENVEVPYKFQSDHLDMRDLPRITWKQEKHRHELEAYERVGYYTNITQGKDPIFKHALQPFGQENAEKDGPAERVQQGPIAETADRLNGVTRPTDDEDAPRDILEQDRWLLLPGEQRQRPVTICVDYSTRRVLRVVLRERVDPKDQLRYDNDLAKRQASIEADKTAFDEQVMQPFVAETAEAAQMGMPLDMAPPEAPEFESMYPEPPPPAKVPFNRWTHYGCFPNPEGFYYLGIAVLAEGPNVVADEVMSRYVSLLTLHMLPTLFYSRQSKMPKGNFELQLGEPNESPLPPEMVNAGGGMHQLQFPPPDPNAFKVAEQQSRSVQDVTADDIVSGAAGMSGQTASETEIRASNAMDNIATVAARYTRARTNEIRTLAYLRSITMKEDGETNYRATRDMGPDGQPIQGVEEYVVTPGDYQDSYDFFFTADPNIASKPQREQQALKVWNVVQQIPPGTLDPTTSVMVVRMAAAEVFKALDRSDVADLIAKAPLPQIPPPGAPGPGEPPPGEGEDDGPGPGGEGMEGPAMDAGGAPGPAGPPPGGHQ